jgi:hypothetical protein
VYASFGNKSNADLLSTYGFILRNNEHDGVSVRVALDPRDSFRSVRAAMLADLNLPACAALCPPILAAALTAGGTHREAVFTLSRAAPVPADLVVVLRVHFMQPSELDRYRAAAEGPVSLENELRVYRRLLALCRGALDAYPTTLEVRRGLGRSVAADGLAG